MFPDRHRAIAAIVTVVRAVDLMVHVDVEGIVAHVSRHHGGRDHRPDQAVE